MRVCKQCNKPILTKNFGLRSFCSIACKTVYRKEYLKQKKQQQRANKNIDIHMSTVSGGFYETTDTKNKIEKLNSEDLRIAKECCNWEMKQKVGYCITLYEPYFVFNTSCKDCYIFHALKQAGSKHGKYFRRTH